MREVNFPIVNVLHNKKEITDSIDFQGIRIIRKLHIFVAKAGIKADSTNVTKLLNTIT